MAYIESDGYERDTDYIPTRITADGRDGYPVEPGRYRLVVARACPWANRAIIVRRLLGLEEGPIVQLGHPVGRLWLLATVARGGRGHDGGGDRADLYVDAAR